MTADFVLLLALTAAMSFSTTIVLFSIFYALFTWFGWLDRPHLYEHERHRHPVPYGLGIVLFTNLALLSILLFDVTGGKIRIVLVLAGILALVNLIDDLDTIGRSPFRSGPIVRLAIQVGVGMVVGLTSIKIGYMTGLLGDVVRLDSLSFILGGVLVYPIPLLFTVGWYVLVFNSVNWSDGIPWLASGFSVIALIVILVLTLKLALIDGTPGAIENMQFVLPILAILIPSALLMSVLDAKRWIILGDSGTMFLGFMIATLAIISGGKVATVATVLGVYLVDALYVILLRISKGKNPLKGDRTHHLHYRLLNMGLSAVFVRRMVFSLSFLFGISVIFLDRTGKVILFIILAVIVVFLTKILSVRNTSKKSVTSSPPVSDIPPSV